MRRSGKIQLLLAKYTASASRKVPLKSKISNTNTIRYGISRRMESHKPRIGKKAPGPWSVGKRHAAKPKAVPQIKDKLLGGWTCDC